MRVTTTLSWAAALLVALAILAAGVADATTKEPHFKTGNVTHVTGTSAQLEGIVYTEGVATSYYFQYGPTLAYGHVTKPVAVPIPSPIKPVGVGQAVTGLQPGWHYRIVGIYLSEGKTVERPGKDRQFTGGKAAAERIELNGGKRAPLTTMYGTAAALSGRLTGLKDVGQALELETMPYPYTGAFTAVPGTVITGAGGNFVFRLPKLTSGIELRVATLTPRPLLSPTLLVHVTPQITLRVRAAGHTGIFRVYGTVTPARNGAPLEFQQLLPQRASSKNEGPRPHAIAKTILKRASSSFSRFSVIVRLTGTYHYRVFVQLPQKGSVVSGVSADVEIRSPKKGTKAGRV